MRFLNCGLLLVLISQVLQLTCAQAAKPVSSVDHCELPPWKADGNLHLGVQGVESPKFYSDNQLILHFSELVKNGQIEEARQFLAEHKETLGNSKNAFLLRSIYLNAIRFGSLDLVESLIGGGLRPPTAAMRVSLLKYALWKRESAIVDKLRANDFETDQFADVALGSIDRLKLALREPAATNKRDENGCTFIHWAALTGRVDLLKLLVDAGASVDDDANCSKPSEKPYYLNPLEVAISLGHFDACKFLLANGAKPNGRPGDIYRPLGIAAKLSNRQLVQSLLGAGAKLNGKDGEGKLAIELTDSESVKALLKPKKHAPHEVHH